MGGSERGTKGDERRGGATEDKMKVKESCDRGKNN